MVPTRAREGQLDRAGISAGSDHEIVLQLSLVAVVDQVDAAVDALVLDLAVVGDVGVPLAGVVADEVVARAGLGIEAGRLCRALAPTSSMRKTWGDGEAAAVGGDEALPLATGCCKASTAAVGVRNSV